MAPTEEISNNESTNLLRRLGFGKFHYMQHVAVALQIYLFALPLNNLDIIAKDTLYRCDIPECDNFNKSFEPEWLINAVPYSNLSPSKCSRYGAVYHPDVIVDFLNGTCPSFLFNENELTPCTNWVFFEGDTFVRELELQCKQSKIELLELLGDVAQCFGYLFIGAISDKYGRKKVLVYSIVIHGVIGFFKSFAPNYDVFAALQFLNAIIIPGVLGAALLLCAESNITEKRVLSSGLVFLSMSLAGMTLGGLSIFIRYWRNLIQVAHVPAVFNIGSVLFTCESIRWLIVNKRYVECKNVVGKIIDTNFKTSPKIVKYHLSKWNIADTNLESTAPSTRLFVELATPHLRWLICAFGWLICSLIYRGLSVNIYNRLSFGVDINFLIMKFTDALAVFLYVIILTRLNRKKCLYLTFICTCFFCGILSFVDEDKEMFIIVVLFLTKLFISVSRMTLIIYSIELFPTVRRHTLLCVCSLLGNIGTISVLGIGPLSVASVHFPYILYSILCLVPLVSLTFLPETSGKELTDYFKESLDLLTSKDEPKF